MEKSTRYCRIGAIAAHTPTMQSCGQESQVSPFSSNPLPQTVAGPVGVGLGSSVGEVVADGVLVGVAVEVGEGMAVAEGV
jgi:hypothetical protein